MYGPICVAERLRRHHFAHKCWRRKHLRDCRVADAGRPWSQAPREKRASWSDARRARPPDPWVPIARCHRGHGGIELMEAHRESNGLSTVRRWRSIRRSAGQHGGRAAPRREHRRGRGDAGPPSRPSVNSVTSDVARSHQNDRDSVWPHMPTWTGATSSCPRVASARMHGHRALGAWRHRDVRPTSVAEPVDGPLTRGVSGSPSSITPQGAWTTTVSDRRQRPPMPFAAAAGERMGATLPRPPRAALHHKADRGPLANAGRFVQLRGDPLPPVALLAPRRISPVPGCDHLDVGVPQLTRVPRGYAGSRLVHSPRVISARHLAGHDGRGVPG